jgi:hypothetical protein
MNNRGFDNRAIGKAISISKKLEGGAVLKNEEECLIRSRTGERDTVALM